jgi:hypothetical protein
MGRLPGGHPGPNYKGHLWELDLRICIEIDVDFHALLGAVLSQYQCMSSFFSGSLFGAQMGPSGLPRNTREALLLVSLNGVSSFSSHARSQQPEKAMHAMGGNRLSGAPPTSPITLESCIF